MGYVHRVFTEFERYRFYLETRRRQGWGTVGCLEREPGVGGRVWALEVVSGPDETDGVGKT